MAPTIVKTVIKPFYSISSATSINSDCCRLPTASAPSIKASNHAPSVLIKKKSAFLSPPSCKKKEGKVLTQDHGDGGLEVMKPAREQASARPDPCASSPEKGSLSALVGRKNIVVINQFFPQKLTVSSLIIM